jgi:hypothetical protein
MEGTRLFSREFRLVVRRLQPQSRERVLDIELANSASDPVLMILLQEIICLIIADVVLVCDVFVKTSLKLTTNTSSTPNLVRLTNINQEMGIVQIENDLRSKFRKIALEDCFLIDPGLG